MGLPLVGGAVSAIFGGIDIGGNKARDGNRQSFNQLLEGRLGQIMIFSDANLDELSKIVAKVRRDVLSRASRVGKHCRDSIKKRNVLITQMMGGEVARKQHCGTVCNAVKRLEAAIAIAKQKRDVRVSLPGISSTIADLLTGNKPTGGRVIPTGVGQDGQNLPAPVTAGIGSFVGSPFIIVLVIAAILFFAFRNKI